MESYYLIDGIFLADLHKKMKSLKMFNNKLTEHDYLESLIFSNKLLQGHDITHNFNHHVSVLDNALSIIEPYMQSETEKDPYFTAFIFYTCIFHDVLSRKYTYQLEIKKSYFIDFLKQKIGNQWPKIVWIIDNLSFTKERKNGYPTHPDKTLQIVRNICSDANRLESLGQIGLDRYYYYQKVMFPTLPHELIIERVLNYCTTVLVLYKDRYIQTVIGKKMAEPLHNIILNFIDCHK